MSLRGLLAALVTAAATAALVHGALDGPRWMLLLGLNLTVAVLVVTDLVQRAAARGTALDLRSGGPRAFAPAVVHRVRAVHRTTGRTVLDAGAPDTAFEFDLTVVPADRPPYRLAVRHPLDLQDARTRGTVVVAYDPEQPWRTIVPPPVQLPPELRSAPAPTLTGPPPDPLVPGHPHLRVLGLGLLLAAALLTVLRLTG